MKNMINAVSCLALIFILSRPQSGWSESFDFLRLLNGTVTDVRPSAITLAPSKVEELEAKSVDVQVNEKTELKNIGVLTAIKIGDDVQIKYIEDQGRNIAVEIAKARSVVN